ncbi:MAG: N-acetylneuraminate synthase family protein [bacterium]|nr:N-acetylneuraminate synthase family protein [bacterium]
MKKIKIGNKWVGEGNPCFIIAEIGANHNQDIEIGKELIDVSCEAGVDAIKFQSFTVKNWISKSMKSFPTLPSGVDIKKELKKCELSYTMYEKFKQYAKNKGVICFSTPSHKEDIDKLMAIGIPAIKFGSVQITDLPTIEYAAKRKKPIMLSTGASRMKEIKEALDTIYSTGNKDVILLHCTSLYPTPIDKVNLRAMLTLMKNFDVPIGYSDHTLDPVLVPTAAVALGACIIEKHITLDRNLKGPDHPFALEPQELKEMVKAIRNTETLLGSGIKQQLPEEKEMAKMGRRSIVAKIKIPSRTRISREMLTLKRPGYGIEPKYINKIIGRTSKKNIEEDTIILWDMLS